MDFSSAQGEIPRIEAIIRSMTPKERDDPDVVDSSRRRRIAAGSGVKTQEINQLLKQFRQMKKVMKQFAERGVGRGPFQAKNPARGPSMPPIGSGRRPPSGRHH